jgi:hypothetical protein
VVSPDHKYNVRIKYTDANASCLSAALNNQKEVSTIFDGAPVPVIDNTVPPPVIPDPLTGGFEYRVQHNTVYYPPALESTVCFRGNKGLEVVDILAFTQFNGNELQMKQMYESIVESLRFYADPVLVGPWSVEGSIWSFEPTGRWTGKEASGHDVPTKGTYEVVKRNKVDGGEEGEIVVGCDRIKGGPVVPSTKCTYTLVGGVFTLNCRGGCFPGTTVMKLP